MNIRVVVIEDHPLMMKAILDELSSQPNIEVVGTAEYGSQLPHLVRETSPNVVILDLGMSGDDFEPISSVRSLHQEFPNAHVLVLTGYDDDIYVRHIVDAGAYGYVLKSDDLSLMLPKGVQKVYEGKRFYSDEVIDKLFDKQTIDAATLSEQELIALRLAAQGHSNVGIAQSMKLSEKRVRNLLSSVYSKFDLHESGKINVWIAAINRACDLGLLASD
jgi:DNA-binding NarL/FixJ family response regulator